MKKPEIKSIPYGEFKDNETLEALIQEINKERTNVLVGKLDELINWGRSNSLWSLTFATICCQCSKQNCNRLLYFGILCR